MTWKKFWKESLAGLIIKNVLLAGVVILILVWGTFKFIDRYTQHGVTEIVPDLRGAYMEEAEIILKAQNLYPQIIDSVYDRDKTLGTIVEQNPAPNATVKRNRPIYLIINSKEVRKISLPGILDFSSRQAEAMILASGLNVESIQYAPSEYKDLVIDVKYKGESVNTGFLIPEGESVVLIVGSGLGDEEIIVPNLRGLSFEDARTEIISSYFIIGATHYEEENANGDYVVYKQQPVDGSMAASGTRINIWLTTDKTLLDKTLENEVDNNQEEEFF